jgi:hypothetical protein
VAEEALAHGNEIPELAAAHTPPVVASNRLFSTGVRGDFCNVFSPLRLISGRDFMNPNL